MDQAKQFDLGGRVSVVTGSARGIGLATARLMRDKGWQVALVDRDGPALAEASQGLPEALALPYDISDPEAVARMVQDVTATNRNSSLSAE